ncbi:MAG: TIGR01459 family HAD-type hydrolase [Proteobacteria bacterium]|nr:TIGR01459 family HAD-type hydrolase [Pseudomonadota bacterium]NCA28111.1 TIGR01459 family HAD-type hydrolase [Pseudomonadota bacterium]
MKKIAGLSEIIQDYNYYIFDIWGVIHDGSKLYPNVLETLNYLRKNHKKICFLSNAPRRASKVEQILNKFGLGNQLYDFVLSSGESTFVELKDNQDNDYKNFGKKYFYIGPEKDLDLLEGLFYQKVDELDKADFVLNTGFDSDNSTIHEKLPLAIQASKFRLPMLCVNPDLIVVKQNGEEMICAGALALEYKKLGGDVHYHGKPFKRVYEMVLEKFSMPNKDSILAIGDGLETDIKGANDFKINNIFVSGGILAKELKINFWQDANEISLKKVFNKYNIFPNYIISNLKI